MKKDEKEKKHNKVEEIKEKKLPKRIIKKPVKMIGKMLG